MSIKHYESSRGRIAYDKRGWGDPLVLVHGIYPGASHDEFRRNIDALSRQYTIYALDLLGFGDSDMPRMTYTIEFYQHLLRNFIVEEIGQPAHIIASGISCGPAVSLAVYNDMLMRKIVLIAPISSDVPINQPLSLTSRLQQFLLGTLSMGSGLYEVISSEGELYRFLQTRYARSRNATRERVAALHERAVQPNALFGFISHMTGHLSTDVGRWLRYVRCEVLIVWGEALGEPPTDQLLRPAAWSRGKRVEVIPRSAHWPHDEQSAAFNALALQFLDDQPAPQAAPPIAT